MSKLAVIGSINMDIVNRVERHPLPGETIPSHSTSYIPGGKGANQAVAAAKNGAEVVFIGAVGDDLFAEPLAQTLRSAGIDTGWLARKQGSCGMAFITVSSEGENSIILSTGANGKLSPADVESMGVAQFASINAVLLQNEIPWETTVSAIHAAKQAGASVYLNPAPARAISDDVLALVDVLIVNETEAYALSHVQIENEAEAQEAARRLINRGVEELVITLGAAGVCYFHRNGDKQRVLALPVEAVDTTAAGDTFIGVYAACREAGMANAAALHRANAAAALAVTRRGAQSSIPAADEIDRWIAARADS